MRMDTDTDTPPPIILLSSERSGTNLLRSLLDNHSRICSPVAPHLLPTFAPLRHYYGDLRDKANSVRLLTDMVDYLHLPYHNWALNVTANDLYEQHAPRSLTQAFHALYTEKTHAEGKIRFCSKDIESFHYARDIQADFPHTKFIYLVRDPRDQVASWIKRPIAYFTVFDAIQKWVEDQTLCLDLMFYWGIAPYCVRYEDLIKDTTTTMSSLLKFLNETVEDLCFNTDASKGREVSWNPYWQNLTKPIMKGNTGQYRDVLNDNDIALIETVAMDLMGYHGYDFVTACDWKAPATFLSDNARIAKQRRNDHQQRISSQMDRLLEKWQYVKALKRRLQAHDSASATTPKASITMLATSERIPIIAPTNTYVGSLRRRARFLLQAILGETATNVLVRRG